MRGDLSGLRRDRAESGQQVERVVKLDLGRRRHPGQGGGLFADHAPLRQFQRELGEVGVFDLRRGEIRHGVLFVLVPEPDADARRGASGAAAALFGGRLRDPDRAELVHTGRGGEERHAREAGIDDDADAGDRDAGLGDRGGEDDAAAVRGREHAVLFGGGERAVENPMKTLG